LEVHAVRREIIRKKHCSQIPFLHELLEVDKQWIAGKGRVAHIGRIAIGGIPKGKNLPQGLTGTVEKIDKMPRRGAKGTDTARAGKRCRMKKNAAFSHSLHGISQDTISAGFPLPTPG
jgi:hypothetical protein